MCNLSALYSYLVFGLFWLMIVTAAAYSTQHHHGLYNGSHHSHVHHSHHDHHLKRPYSHNNSNVVYSGNHIGFQYDRELRRKPSLLLNAAKSSIASLPNSKSITSPLKLTLIQANGHSIASNNYPSAVNRHAYRWPFIVSTTTSKSILHAKKPDSRWQTSTKNTDVRLIATSTEAASTQQPVVDHHARAHHYHHHHHHTGQGRHVCVEYKSSQSTTAQEYQRHHNTHQAILCRNATLCDSTRHFYQHLNAVTKRDRSSQHIYTCCPGWTKVHKDSIGCTKPICKRPCQNNGKCIKPEQCSCPSGYTGAHCELDIDECINDKPCDQMCHNTDGSFYCTCRLGFILHSDRQSCKKIDSTFGTDDTDIAFEAKDLENDVDNDGLAVRVNNIEQMLAAEKKQNAQTNKLMQHTLATLNDIKHRIDGLENRQHDINVLRERLKTVEMQAQTLQYNLEVLYKCRHRPSIYCP